MPTSITLKNIPDALYARLKAAAVANHRSLNGQVLATLEATAHAGPTLAHDVLRRASARHSQQTGMLSAAEIASAISDGRP